MNLNAIPFEYQPMAGAFLGEGFAAALHKPISVSNGYVGKVVTQGEEALLKIGVPQQTSGPGPMSQYLQIQNEKSVLTRLAGDYSERILRYQDSEEYVGILLSWVPGASISSVVKSSFDEGRLDEVVSYYRKGRGDLSFIHQQGIAHADVQPTHVRFQKSETLPKSFLIDFGVSGSLDSYYGGGFMHYLMSEAAEELLSTGKCRRSIEADIFALAASFASSLFNCWPYDYEAFGVPLNQRGREARDQKLAVIAQGAPTKTIEMLQDAGLGEIAEDLTL